MPGIDPFNLSNAEFDTVMTEIDQELRRRSDQVPGREVGAIALFVQRFRVQMDHRHPVTRRIIEWFTRLYGDRLNLDRDYGQTVALLNGEICSMRGVMFFGNLPIVCTSAAMGVKLKLQSPLGDIDVANLLEGRIEGVTPELASRLSQVESDAILKAYGNMFLAYCRLEAALGVRYGATDAPYVKEAVHDLRTSAQRTSPFPSHRGDTASKSCNSRSNFL